ncbi:MAG TPA: hypothetical protein VK211_21035 [Kamptonema sp.]|nr:hypothetical protein [Kamptonema sp.]
MGKLASVIQGTIELPSGKTVEVGSKLWREWLEHPETKSFRVDDGEGYTARKETAKGYWYAYRKVEGKLHKRYIGVSEALTLERLAKVGGLFDIPSQPKLPKPVGNSVDSSQELHNQLGNLSANNVELHKELGNLQANNVELHNQVTQLKAELADVRSQSDKLKEKREKWINELLEENTLLRHRVQELEGTGSLLRAEESKNKELEQERKELREQLHGLLQLQTSQAQELRKVRSQLSDKTAPQDSKILELPDAADLLNQLKAKRKKSKTDLQDVEAILELLPEMPAQESQSQLPDLYAARDKLFEMPSLGGWKFEKGEKRDRFYAFAEALIEEISKLNPNYTIIQRLQSDLKQATERCEGYGNQLREKTEIIHKQEVKLGQRKLL